MRISFRDHEGLEVPVPARPFLNNATFFGHLRSLDELRNAAVARGFNPDHLTFCYKQNGKADWPALRAQPPAAGLLADAAMPAHITIEAFDGMPSLRVLDACLLT